MPDTYISFFLSLFQLMYIQAGGCDHVLFGLGACGGEPGDGRQSIATQEGGEREGGKCACR